MTWSFIVCYCCLLALFVSVVVIAVCWSFVIAVVAVIAVIAVCCSLLLFYHLCITVLLSVIAVVRDCCFQIWCSLSAIDAVDPQA